MVSFLVCFSVRYVIRENTISMIARYGSAYRVIRVIPVMRMLIQVCGLCVDATHVDMIALCTLMHFQKRNCF